MNYKNYTTVSGNKADGTALATKPISSSNVRDVFGREFCWACAFNREATASTTVTLRYKKNSSVSDSNALRIDSVTLLAGESAVWNHEDYGFDMGSNGYVEIIASGSQSVDFFVRTRDKGK